MENSSLLFMPEDQFSSRYGSSFFTFKPVGFHLVEESCFSSFAVFELSVKNGNLTWKVEKRFSEFYALGNSIKSKELAIQSQFPELPKKTCWFPRIHDINFLTSRQEELGAFLEKILIVLGEARLRDDEVLKFLGFENKDKAIS